MRRSVEIDSDEGKLSNCPLVLGDGVGDGMGDMSCARLEKFALPSARIVFKNEAILAQAPGRCDDKSASARITIIFRVCIAMMKVGSSDRFDVVVRPLSLLLDLSRVRTVTFRQADIE